LGGLKMSSKIGDRIQALRKARQITQKQLANICGVHWVTVSKWEHEVQSPEKHLLKIAEVFGVSIEYLTTGVKSRHEQKLEQFQLMFDSNPELQRAWNDVMEKAAKSWPKIQFSLQGAAKAAASTGWLLTGAGPEPPGAGNELARAGPVDAERERLHRDIDRLSDLDRRDVRGYVNGLLAGSVGRGAAARKQQGA
jgi:transcriptional regulator with XRE-family HTH domain